MPEKENLQLREVGSRGPCYLLTKGAGLKRALETHPSCVTSWPGLAGAAPLQLCPTRGCPPALPPALPRVTKVEAGLVEARMGPDEWAGAASGPAEKGERLSGCLYPN